MTRSLVSRCVAPAAAAVSRWQALRRGLSGLCPRCGEARLFSRYLRVRPACGRCGLDLDSYPADDAPPYFTILIVGHIVVPLVLMLEQTVRPAAWVHSLVWIPATTLLTLALLPRIKGAVVGWQWAFGIRR